MKHILYTTLWVTSVITAGHTVLSASASQVATKEVVIGVNDAYIPGGFGSDSDAYVIVSGMFPNSCYRWNRADVKAVSTTVHEVRSIATVSQTMCLMVLVPYSKEVSLGRLQPGEHTLRFMNGDGTHFEKTLVVE